MLPDSQWTILSAMVESEYTAGWLAVEYNFRYCASLAGTEGAESRSCGEVFASVGLAAGEGQRLNGLGKGIRSVRVRESAPQGLKPTLMMRRFRHD